MGDKIIKLGVTPHTTDCQCARNVVSPEAFPAVTVPDPSVINAGRNFCKPSSVDCALGNSSSHTLVTPAYTMACSSDPIKFSKLAFEIHEATAQETKNLSLVSNYLANFDNDTFRVFA